MGMRAGNIILPQHYTAVMPDAADHRIYDSSFSSPTVLIIAYIAKDYMSK